MKIQRYNVYTVDDFGQDLIMREEDEKGDYCDAYEVIVALEKKG